MDLTLQGNYQGLIRVAVFVLVASCLYSFLTATWVGATDAITPSTPSGGSPHNQFETTRTFSFTWNPSVDNQSEVKYEVRISQEQARLESDTNTSGVWQSGLLTTPMLSVSNGIITEDGDWYWQARAVDESGHQSAWSKIWKVTVDTTPPSLRLIQPADRQVFRGEAGQQIIIESYIEDATSGPHVYHIGVDENELPAEEEPSSWMATASSGITIRAIIKNIDEFTEGPHLIHIWVNDYAGNISEAWRTISIDKTPPTITSSLVDGQSIAGVFPVTLSTDEVNPNDYYTGVFDMNGSVVSVGGEPQEKLETASGPSSTYMWDTTKLPNGDYQILQRVRDAAGYDVTAVHIVHVNNPPAPEATVTPLLTIDDKLDGRTIAGTINVQGATFIIKLDDIVQDDIQVQVGDQKGGVYEWSFVLPEGITGDTPHHLRVEAEKDGVSAEPKTMIFQLESTATGTQKVTPMIEDPLLKELSTTLSQPFPTPVAFTTAFLSDAERADKNQPTETSPQETAVIKPAPVIDRHTSSSPLASTEQGWRIWGILWYWWAAVGMTGIFGWQFLKRLIKRKSHRQTGLTFLMDANDV